MLDQMGATDDDDEEEEKEEEEEEEVVVVVVVVVVEEEDDRRPPMDVLNPSAVAVSAAPRFMAESSKSASEIDRYGSIR